MQNGAAAMHTPSLALGRLRRPSRRVLWVTDPTLQSEGARMFDWDDLKHLLAVARHGSTLAAGRALGVDQSTVQRRLAELERRLEQPLVERQPSGYKLTDFGREMLPYAERVEQSVAAFEE